MNVLFPEVLQAKPFLKWAGGKGQLIPAIEKRLPHDLKQRRELTYIEPFIGSGAVLFWILQKYPSIRKAVISDINHDLTQAYTTIKEQPLALIRALQELQTKYYKLISEEERKNFFLEKREIFNLRNADTLSHTVLLIFLNRTCFNGLYRVNSKNLFNVPFGRYEKPRICDPETIMADSHLLQRVTILNADFEVTLNYAGTDSFFYFDPPYRPLNNTSSFNSYTTDVFDDKEQTRLKQFCDVLSSKNYQWLLSNSDPRNTNPDDNFFDDLYADESIQVDRVKAKRSINSDPSKRGEIAELLIYNYAQKPAL
ncbi:DNA adenine methylase [Emticicia sp. 17c]|uniref:DNA adenine methylase n=1 Tax=Emticicia sp. 17c TaxID=3127704 RepID=UPI00301E3D19